MHSRFAAFALVLAPVLGITAAAAADDAPQEQPADAPRAEPATPKGSARRVRVRLRAGRTVEGVVLAPGTWERRDAVSGWVAARREDKGAGVRLWWIQDLDGFQFVSVRDMVELKEAGTVSAEQTRDAEKRRREMAERTDAERAKADAERAAAASAEAKAKELIQAVEAAKAEAAAAEAVKAATTVKPSDTKRFAELLGRFPPEKWKPTTPADIEHRRIILGVNPTEEDRAFLAVFDEWKKAWDAWSAAQAALKSSAPPPADAKQ